jgi:hypothetical protein
MQVKSAINDAPKERYTGSCGDLCAGLPVRIAGVIGYKTLLVLTFRH